MASQTYSKTALDTLLTSKADKAAADQAAKDAASASKLVAGYITQTISASTTLAATTGTYDLTVTADATLTMTAGAGTAVTLIVRPAAGKTLTIAGTNTIGGTASTTAITAPSMVTLLKTADGWVGGAASSGASTGTGTGTGTGSGPSNAYLDAVRATGPQFLFPLQEKAGATTVAVEGFDAARAGTPTITGAIFGAAGIGTLPASVSFSASGSSSIAFPGITAAMTGQGSEPRTVELLCYPELSAQPTNITFLVNAAFGLGFDNYEAGDVVSYRSLGRGGGQWKSRAAQHLAVVYDRTSITHYLNGVQTFKQTTGIQPGENVTLALGGAAGKWFYTGRLAGVALYDQALNAATVLEHARAAGVA